MRQAKLQDQYDWIVLGDHPAALMTAVLAARLDLKVLVLPMAVSARLREAKDDRGFVDPEINRVPGWSMEGELKEEGLLDRCLKWDAEARKNLRRIDFQALTPRHRAILLASDSSDLEREMGDSARVKALQRVVDVLGPEYRKFWNHLIERVSIPPEQERKKFQLRKPWSLRPDPNKLWRESIGGRPTSEERFWFSSAALHGVDEKEMGSWRGILSALLGLDSGMDRESPRLADVFASWSDAQGSRSFRGGLSRLREVLLDQAEAAGAAVSDDVHCRALLVEEGHFSGIQVAQRTTILAARGIAVSCGLDHAREYLSAEKRKNWQKKLILAPEATGWCFSIMVAVRKEAIPPGATSKMVWQEKGAPSLIIELAELGEYEHSEPGTQIVFLRTYLPYTMESLGGEYQRVVAARMLRKLSELFPFVENHLVRIYPDFRRGVEELREVYGFPSLTLIPENIRRYGAKGRGTYSGIDRMYVVSGESYPELGPLGSWIAGVEALSAVAQAKGFIGPLGNG